VNRSGTSAQGVEPGRIADEVALNVEEIVRETAIVARECVEALLAEPLDEMQRQTR
jgi:hypothetical protein